MPALMLRLFSYHNLHIYFRMRFLHIMLTIFFIQSVVKNKTLLFCLSKDARSIVDLMTNDSRIKTLRGVISDAPEYERNHITIATKFDGKVEFGLMYISVF